MSTVTRRAGMKAGILAAALTLACAAPSIAATGSHGHSRAAFWKPGTVSIQVAHRAAVRFEHASPITGTVGHCHSRGSRVACAVTWTGVIVDGSAPVTFGWTDVVGHVYYQPQLTVVSEGFQQQIS